jgi:putative phage-type endonuclease
MEQGTTEWFNARLGKITASRLNAVMAKTKSGYSATRSNYMMELICQKLSGQREESYSNAAMERGVELEPIARGAYEAANGLFVEEIGLVDHPAIKGFAASPDGLVGDKGLIEIKCPNTATHVEFLKSGKIKRDYILQVHAQMLCTERDWCDFVSYDDRLDGLEYKCVRVEFDPNLAHEIMMEVNKFLTEMYLELQTILKLKEESK